MNDERLAKLKERAEKATQIAADISALKLAQDGAMRLIVRHWNTGDEPLDDKLSRDVLVAGLAAVLAQKEIELEMLLNGGAYLGEPFPQRPELPADNPAIWIAPVFPQDMHPHWMPPPNFDITGDPSNAPPLRVGETSITCGGVQCRSADGLTSVSGS